MRFLSIIILISLFLILVIFVFLNPKKEMGFNAKLPTCQKCNIILISVDTLGAKHLGMYGHNKQTSPFLDKFSSENGIIFNNAISQAPWTLPSHTAMLTGNYPFDYNVWTQTDTLPNEAKTIAESIKEQGYKTQAFSTGPFVQPEWNLNQGFDGFAGSRAQKDWDDVPMIFDDSLKWISENKNSPFFLFIHSFHVHDPYTPFKQALDLLSKEVNEVHIKDIVEVNTRPGGATNLEKTAFENAYDNEIVELDQALRKFFEELRKLDVADNTVLVLTADHGEEFGEHGTTGFHITTYNETLHVPLVVFTPNTKAQRIDDVVEIRSIPATILQILNLNAEPAFKAKSLFDKNKSTIALSFSSLQREMVLGTIEKAYAAADELGKTVFLKPRIEKWNSSHVTSARSKEWHLIKNHDGSIELYNLTKDKEEKNNLYQEWTSLPMNERAKAFEVIKAILPDTSSRRP